MNNTILVTGATSDIALEFLNKIKNKNNIVLAFYRNNKEKLELFKNDKIKIVPIYCDFNNIDNLSEIMESVSKEYQIDMVLHFAAAGVKNERFHKISVKQVELDFKVQYLSIFTILKYVLPVMKKNKKGKIIFLLSSFIIGVPPKFLTSYISMKYALLGLMKSLVSEYGNFNIQINAISPSMFQSKFLENIDKIAIEMYKKNHPMKELIKKDEIINIILFLLENENKFLNGNNFNLSGSETL